ncbi:hypothetical protein U0070_010765, partial [Myodes glareolus]
GIRVLSDGEAWQQITETIRQRSGRGGVLGCPVADNDAAVDDAGPVPAFPKLGVLAPMLEKDVADAWRVIREGVGDLLPCGTIPLLDGHRWRLAGGQDDVVRRGQLYPDVIGAAAVCSGGKPVFNQNVGPEASFVSMKTALSQDSLSPRETRNSHCLMSLSHVLQTKCCISSLINWMEHFGFVWFGLNVPFMKSETAHTIDQRCREQEMREEWNRRRRMMKVKGEHGWSGNKWGVLSIALSRPGTQWRNTCINVFYMTANERRIVIQCPFGMGNVNGATGFAIERHVHYHHILPHCNKGHVCKITGFMITISLTLGLFYGLGSQETQQDLAYKKGHHMVEFFE